MSGPRPDWRTRYDWRTRPLRLDAADHAALINREPKLSRIPPAHWRNVYEFEPGLLTPDWCEQAVRSGAEELADGIWRAGPRHVSREIAEQLGCKWAAAENARLGRRACRYLRAEKFDGEAP
jgi:hypothetical protein